MIDMTYHPTQAEFAALVGISQPAVSGLLSRGIITEGGTLAEWSAMYCDHLREKAAGRATEGNHDLATERARLAHHNANIASMEERRRAGELCDMAGVVITMARIGSNFRTALERVADKLADRLAVEAEPHACHQIINAELQQTLDQLAKDCEAAALDIKGQRQADE
jgi:phage terminase Nu1 subunit (DNA packaging protein)